MITPTAFSCILKHFDEIDRIVSARLLRKRPHNEISLTSRLADLLDEETQEEEKISYTFKDLQAELAKEDNLFGISLSIDTVEFNSAYERYISQSDIGLRLIYENEIEPEQSWIKPYLLQAKRLFPKTVNPLIYTEASRYASVDNNQQGRIKLLQEIIGDTYLKYLLFNPRPDGLDDETKIKLAYLRNNALASQIFDFTSGLTLHKELLNGSETLKAGIFITGVENNNLNFGQVHQGLLHSTSPFSWFVATQYTDYDSIVHAAPVRKHSTGLLATSENHQLVNGIIEGDSRKIDELISKIQKVKTEDFPSNIQVLPKHTLTLKVSVGEQINPNNRLLRSE